MLKDRIRGVRKLVETTKLETLPMDGETPEDVSRDARGLAVLLLFAAYENLLYSLCRNLLEVAAKSRARGARLKPGIRLFLVHKEISGLGATGQRKLWKTSGPQLIAALSDRPASDLDMEAFPDDGSYMKASQVKLFCEVFEFGDPGPILREVWGKIDSIVDQRNGIAHGRLLPDEVGRNFTHDEIINLITAWEDRWTDFLDWIEGKCSEKKFYLI